MIRVTFIVIFLSQILYIFYTLVAYQFIIFNKFINSYFRFILKITFLNKINIKFSKNLII